MLDKIIKFALHNRLLVLFAFLLVVISGTFITRSMDVDIFPDLNAPRVVVLTEAPGMAPEEVEKLVSFPIETAMNGVSGIRVIRSSSSMGYSIVWVEFKWGVQSHIARQRVSEKLLQLKDRLPENVAEPVLAPEASLLGEIMIFNLQSDSLSMAELKNFAVWNLRPRILALGGISQVTILGGADIEYQINPIPAKMSFYKVGMDEILEACESANINTAGGFVNQFGKKYTIRNMSRTDDPEDLKTIVVKNTDKGEKILLGDVCDIQIGTGPQIGKGSYNGSEALVVTISSQPGVNTVDLTKIINDELQGIEKEVPGIQIQRGLYEQASFIKVAVNNVIKALLEGSVFVVVILLLFLMNIRTTVISLITIPVSLLITFIVLKAMGSSINTMTLGGMAIAIGSLVDDAIIDVENVYKRLRAKSDKIGHDKGLKLNVVFKASSEIRVSIMNATFIIMVAFIPLFFLSGFEGRMLKPLGVAYIISIFSSLLVALTLTPVLCSFLLTNEQFLKKHKEGSWVERNLKKFYARSLQKALSARQYILAVAGLLFVVSVFLLFRFGGNFLPPFNEGALTINLATLPGISLEQSDKLGQQAEEILLSFPEIDQVGRKTGRAELAEHSFGDNVSEIEVPFKLKDRSRDAFLEQLRSELSTIPGLIFSVGQPITHRIDHMLSGSKTAIAIKLFGENIPQMYTYATQIKKQIELVEGVGDVSVEQQTSVPEIHIDPSRTQLASYGIPLAAFNSYIETGFNGRTLSEVFKEGRSYPLVVRFDDKVRAQLLAPESVPFVYQNAVVPISELASVNSSNGFTTISRENLQRKLVIGINVGSRDLQSVVDDIKDKMNELDKPAKIRVEYGGQFESAASVKRLILLASVLSILLIFVLLFQQFRNMKLALIVLVNLPLALIGGVAILALTTRVLDIPAIIGFITLFGIATRNGLLLISHYNDLQKKGTNFNKLIIEGASDRLIPILMTALTAALSLVPMAMAGTQPGNEIQSPMAKVILGGLLSSTLLNIYLVPIIYHFTKRNKLENEIIL